MQSSRCVLLVRRSLLVQTQSRRAAACSWGGRGGGVLDDVVLLLSFLSACLSFPLFVFMSSWFFVVLFAACTCVGCCACARSSSAVTVRSAALMVHVDVLLLMLELLWLSKLRGVEPASLSSPHTVVCAVVSCPWGYIDLRMRFLGWSSICFGMEVSMDFEACRAAKG